MTDHQWPFAENTLFEYCCCEHRCTQADKKPLSLNEVTIYVCSRCEHADFYYVKKEDEK